jgi:hypothetical protein
LLCRPPHRGGHNGNEASVAGNTLEAIGARWMRPTRLRRLSPADEANEVDGASASAAGEALEAYKAKPMMPTRLKRPSPAGEADEANGWEASLAR